MERPREQTIEEIAGQQDLAPSTEHKHLQNGIRKLVDGMVDSPSGYRADRA